MDESAHAPCYVEDLYPRQVLYALTIRSPVARGRLRSIECPKLPGTYTLITARDIPGKNALEEAGLPLLADDRLSYIGEPAALLLGPDKPRLEAYAAQCVVRADAEEPVFSPAAVSGGTVLARRDLDSAGGEELFPPGARIIRGDYRTGIQEHWYAEPVGAVAWYERMDREGEEGEHSGGQKGKTLIVRTATQWPYHVKRALTRALKIDPACIRVEPTITGFHMDGKIWYPSLVACHAALGAVLTGKPVRLVLTREEDFRFSPKRAAADVSFSSALDEKGDLAGTEIEIAVNLGACGIQAQEILDQVCLGSLGLYRFGGVRLTGRAVCTNIPPQGPFSGFGLAQGFFALERHVSHIADLHKQDPAEWRKNHLAGNTACEELLGTAASMGDYHRKWASSELLRQSRRQRSARGQGGGGWAEKGETLRGIGIALGYQGSGLLYPGADRGNYGIEVTLTKDSELEINTSMVIPDDDYGRIWAAMAAEILAIDPDKVRILNSAGAPDSGPACASRNITVITRLMEKCCIAVRKQRFRDPLPITVRRQIKPLPLPLLQGRFPPPEGKVMDASGFVKPGLAAAVVEVEIDSVEYVPTIRGVWLAVNGGKILSEDRARRSLKIAAVEALGWSFWEQAGYVEGAIPQGQFEQYQIPAPGDIPPVHIDFIWNDSGEPKGIGELPFTCVPAAYLQAVSQAMDHHFQSIPLGREDIWEAGKLKKTESPLP
jgi:CO/xanthine dehydrogenase Mo-binding subunit